MRGAPAADKDEEPDRDDHGVEQAPLRRAEHLRLGTSSLLRGDGGGALVALHVHQRGAGLAAERANPKLSGARIAEVIVPARQRRALLPLEADDAGAVVVGEGGGGRLLLVHGVHGVHGVAVAAVDSEGGGCSRERERDKKMRRR